MFGPPEPLFEGRLQAATCCLIGDVTPVLRGWLTYFTMFYPIMVIPLGKHTIAIWCAGRGINTSGFTAVKRVRGWLQGVREREPRLFANWKPRYTSR
jgi:RNA-directed DNA polymerase